VTRIEIGITHEVSIKGDKSWVRLAITDDFDPTVDDLDEAVSDLSAKVNQQLIKVIENTVETVSNYQ
jgi:protein-tyrosine phosphatase